MSKITDKQNGFTLIEVIITVTAAGFILLGLGAMVTNLSILSKRSQDLITATSAIEDKFEDLRSGTYLALADGTMDFTSELPAILAEPKSATYTIADSSLTDVSEAVKEINITVTYNNHNGSETLNYTGYIGELGVGQY